MLTGKEAVFHLISERIDATVKLLNHDDPTRVSLIKFCEIFKKVIGLTDPDPLSNYKSAETHLIAEINEESTGSSDLIINNFINRKGESLSPLHGFPNTGDETLSLLLHWIYTLSDDTKQKCLRQSTAALILRMKPRIDDGHRFLLLPGRDPQLQPLLKGEMTPDAFIAQWKANAKGEARLILGDLNYFDPYTGLPWEFGFRYDQILDKVTTWSFGYKGHIDREEIGYIGERTAWELKTL